MSIDDVEDVDNILVVKVVDPKTHRERIFTVPNWENIELYRKYKALRPSHATTKRLFLKYRNGKCANQHVGINQIGEIPSRIALFLKKEEPKKYTGHCYRKTSSTLWKLC